MQNENTKPETTQPRDLRSALLDINAFAADALYRSYATPEDAHKGYRAALEDIRKILNPGTFFTPSAALDDLVAAMPKREGFLAKHRMCYVRLPGLYGVRFDGIERQDGTRRAYGAFCRTVAEDLGLEHFEIFCDNAKVAAGDCYIGHSVAAAMVKSMARTLIRRKEHAIRNRANRKAKRAETVEPIEPADAIPSRPGLQEDDE